MRLLQKGSKVILVSVLLLTSWIVKGQDDTYMSAYVSALERDLDCNDDLYRTRRAAEFDHVSVLATMMAM